MLLKQLLDTVEQKEEMSTLGFESSYSSELDEEKNLTENNLTENNINYTIIKLSGKKGGEAYVNNDDLHLVSPYKWHQNTDGYAANKNKTVMHHFILKPVFPLVVNHKNNNKLDNRRENLEIVTIAENNRNRLKKTGDATCQYKNVIFNKKSQKYMVRITFDNKQTFLGEYNTPLEAAFAIDMYVVYTPHMKDYNLNFPDKKEEYLNTVYVPRDTRIKKSNYYGVGVDTKNQNIYVGRVSNKNVQTQIYRGPDEQACALACDLYIVTNTIPKKILNFPEKFPEYNANHEIKTLCEKIENIELTKLLKNENNIDDKTLKLLIEEEEKNNIVKLLVNRVDEGVTINESDYDKVKNYTCSITTKKNLDGKEKHYIVILTTRTMFLHRYLINPPEELVCDHIDGNTLNNTRKNLRVITSAQNSQNKLKQSNCTSIYMGVSFDKNRAKWTAKIQKDGKKIYAKYFCNQLIAARARDSYILEHISDGYYKRNFEWGEEDILIWRDIMKNENIYSCKTIKDIFVWYNPELTSDIVDNLVSKYDVVQEILNKEEQTMDNIQEILNKEVFVNEKQVIDNTTHTSTPSKKRAQKIKQQVIDELVDPPLTKIELSDNKYRKQRKKMIKINKIHPSSVLKDCVVVKNELNKNGFFDSFI